MLTLERSHIETRAWLDGRALGTSNSLSTPHEYELGTNAAPGKHRLTISVDNTKKIDLGRFVSINGQPVEQLKGQHFPLRMLESAELSWADVPPEGDKITQGAWWKDAGAAELAVDEGVARRLHLGVGSAVELELGGTATPLKVGAVYRSDG